MAYRDPKVVGTANQITVTESTNSTTLALAGPAGITTLTAHGVLIGAGTSPIAATSAGTAGQVLQSGGAAADPAFSTATYPLTTLQGDILSSTSANTIVTLPKNASATRYLSNTGASNNAAWTQVFASTGISGVLPLANGGLNSTGLTGIVSGSGTAYFGRTLTGTTNQITVTNGTGASANPTVSLAATMVNATQPCFLARVSGTTADVTGDGTAYTILFDNEIFDQGSNYAPGTGLFTAPVTGRYFFQAVVTLSGVLIGHTTTALAISNVGVDTYTTDAGAIFTIIDAAGLISVGTSMIINLTATNTVSIILTVTGGAKVVDVYGQNISTWFSGYLVA